MFTGYGDITPQTNEGKLFLVFYGAIGISLMVLLLTFGAQIETLFIQHFVKKINACRKKNQQDSEICENEEFLVFVVSLLLMIPVGAVAIVIIKLRTNWSVINSLYFWFCTVTTIGFGDFVIPNHKATNIIQWLLLKVITLGAMAGVINSFAIWLQKKRMLPKLKRFKKKLQISERAIELD